MAATRLWIRSTVRSSWRSVSLVVLITALCSGVTMVAVAGARRTTTSFTRFVHDTREPQVFVAAPDAATSAAVASVMREFTEPERVGQAVFVAAAPAAVDLSRQIEISVIGGLDDTIGRTFWLPKVIAGHPASGPDEVNVNEVLADELGLQPGDEMAMVGYSPAVYVSCAEGMDCETDVDLGKVTIAGVLRRPGDISPESYGAMNIELSPSVTARWLAQLATIFWLSAAWVEDSVDRQEMGAALTKAIGAARVEGDTADVFIDTDSTGDPERTEGALRVERNGLLILALLAALSGVLAVPQALVRQQATAGAGGEQMRALGSTHRDLLTATALVSLAVGTLAAAAAAIGAVIASPLMPIGLARRADPSLGTHVDLAVLACGVAFTIAYVTVSGAVVALMSRRRRRTSALRVGRFARMLAVVPPVPSLAGRFLFDHTRVSTVARTSLGAAVLGVTVIAGASLVVKSQDVLVSRPAMFGAPWDVQGLVLDDSATALEVVKSNPRIDAAAVLHGGRMNIGERQVPLVGVDTIRGELTPTMLDGEPVERDGEVVLSPSIMDELHLDIGDRIEVGSAGELGSLAVVGRGVPIAVGIYSDEDGAVVNAADFARFGFQNDIEGEGGVEVAVRGAPGTDPAALRTDLEPVTKGFDRVIAESFHPARIANIERVRSVTTTVIGFAALLTGLVVVHALVVVAQRRRSDLAVVRALGMSLGQARRVIMWHSAMVGAIVAAIGVPVGVIAGRLVWRSIATSVDAVYSPHVPVVALVVLAASMMFGTVAAAAVLRTRSVPRALAPWLRSE